MRDFDCATRSVWLAAIISLTGIVPIVFADDSAAKSDVKPATGEKKKSAAERQQLADVVVLAFHEVHDGWSTDEVVLKDDLNQKFLEKCKAQLPDISAAECNWTLLNLRKAGKLGTVTTKRERLDPDEYQHAAEIAARFVQDKYEQTIDRVLCDPERRAEFDKAALALAPKVEPYKLRKAAFGLRKARQLQPELVTRVVEWKKEVVQFPVADLIANGKLVPDNPGVYIFRDATGYLYIGESSNLRQRIHDHLDGSDRKSLAQYLTDKGSREISVELHIFDKESPAKDKTRRRAYESELIRSRKPRLNIAP